jgi:hypothetical protein
VADLAPARAADRAHLADAEGREVVVQHVRLPRLAFQLLDALLVALGAERGDRQRLGLAAGEEARAVGARQRADLDRDLADLARPAAVGAHALCEHHLAQLVALEVVQGLADVRLLLGEALLEGQNRLGLNAVHLLLTRLLAGDADRLAQLGAARVVERLHQLRGVGRHHQRALLLAGALDQVTLDPDNGADVLGRELERIDDRALGQLARPALDHDDVVGGARHHHVHVALLELGHGGVHHELAVHAAHTHAGDRLRERDVRQVDRGGCAAQGEHVGVVLLVGGDDRRHDLCFEREMLGEQRPDRPVDEAGAQDFLLGRPSFPLEKAAGNLPGGVRALAVVHREGHEIAIGAGGLGGARRDQDDRPSHLDQGGAARQLGHLAGADRERLSAQLDRYFLFHRDPLSSPFPVRPSPDPFPSPPANAGARAARPGSTPSGPERDVPHGTRVD